MINAAQNQKNQIPFPVLLSNIKGAPKLGGVQVVILFLPQNKVDHGPLPTGESESVLSPQAPFGSSLPPTDANKALSHPIAEPVPRHRLLRVSTFGNRRG
jgi:hypothetical protein